MPIQKQEPPKGKTESIDNFLLDIKKKANDIYLERQYKNKPGNEVSDWLQAEEIIKKKHHIK